MVFEKIKMIVSDHFEVEEDEVNLETNFIEDLGADIFDVIELLKAIEDEFDTEIVDEDMETIDTVGEAVDYINDIL